VLVSAGSEVVVAEPGKSILPGEDRQMAKRLESILGQDGLSIRTKTEAEKISQVRGGFEVALSGQKGGPESFNRVLYFSRRPDLSGLGLDTVGLKNLNVDRHMATGALGVWAVGDVTGLDRAFSHASSRQGMIAAENATGGRAVYDHRTVPRVVYSRPQMAAVGLSEKETAQAGYEVITGLVPMGLNSMAMILGQAEGAIKIVGEAQYGEVLGVHVISPMATEIIGQAALALQVEMTLDELGQMALPHPTISESLADAARSALGQAIYLPKQSA